MSTFGAKSCLLVGSRDSLFQIRSETGLFVAAMWSFWRR